jgi:hypothetical protein
MRVSGISIPRFLRASCVALLAIGAGAVTAAPAGAWEEEPKGPEYSISIVEGVTTQPEESILHTSGSVRVPHTNHVPITLRIVHNGLTVAQDTETEGNAWLSQVPQVGDTVYLESPTGTVVGTDVYDGLPSMEPTVCAGSTDFSGQRSGGDEVEGSVETLVAHPNYTAHRPGGVAQVTGLSGSAFSGSFLVPLAVGETVQAAEHLRTPLAGGAVFTFFSENQRPVGACPVPPPPPLSLPAPALQGFIFKLTHATIRSLLKLGWLTKVSINQPGTITQDLYAQGGTLPAYAASARKGKHHKPPPATLLARGVASANGAGTVVLVMHATSKGRAVLKHDRRIKAVLITTLQSTSGAKLDLSRRSITLNA